MKTNTEGGSCYRFIIFGVPQLYPYTSLHPAYYPFGLGLGFSKDLKGCGHLKDIGPFSYGILKLH